MTCANWLWVLFGCVACLVKLVLVPFVYEVSKSCSRNFDIWINMASGSIQEVKKIGLGVPQGGPNRCKDCPAEVPETRLPTKTLRPWKGPSKWLQNRTPNLTLLSLRGWLFSLFFNIVCEIRPKTDWCRRAAAENKWNILFESICYNPSFIIFVCCSKTFIILWIFFLNLDLYIHLFEIAIYKPFHPRGPQSIQMGFQLSARLFWDQYCFFG